MDRSQRQARVPRTVWAIGLLTAWFLVISPHANAQVFEPPRLTVMIVVDQFQQDVFEHYLPAFQHGFRRLADEGYRFTEASHAHARTSTAPGHATLATGVFPARHGIVANNWQQRRGVGWAQTYAVQDDDSPILGFEDIDVLEGRSPRTMLREGLPDWFGAMNDRSRRVSISRKDRAAVPMGGQRTEHVYWILPELARFVTSTYYARDYPRWLMRFNERVMPGIAEPEMWESIVPDQYRNLARPDSAAFENDGVHSVFPHVSADEIAPDTVRLAHYMWAFDQPRADDAVMALAAVAIDELELGQRNEQDFLALSLSASDRVGHGYGPYSQEVLSTMLNIDRLLGEFFELLDKEVGEGRWVVGVSGDHGVATMPEYARELGNPDADRILASEVRAGLSEVLNEVARGGGTPDQLADRLARGVEERGIATRAYTHFDLTRREMPDSFAVFYRNSYYPGRAWDDLSRWGVDLRYGEGDYVGAPTGINHESPYWYDRHVPILFLGAGVQPGLSDTPVYTVDFAPTLAGLAGIIVPDDLDGRRIY
jgi:hypothetical protein